MARSDETTDEELAKLIAHAEAATPAPAGGRREAEERPPDVGPAETFVNKAVGAIPLGNLITNLTSTGLLHLHRALTSEGERAQLTQAARDELAARGEDVPEAQGMLDTYRQVRDERRERTAAGAEQNPGASKAGTAMGIASTVLAPLPGISVAARVAPGAKAATQGAQFLARLKSGAATGGAYGALGGATDGDADLTRGQVARAAAQTAGGAAFGAGLGAAGAGVAEGLSRSAPLWRAFGIDMGRRTINNRADLATRNKHPLSDEAVVEALDRDMFRPAGVVPVPPTTPEVYKRLVTAADEEGSQLGQILKDLEAEGVTGSRAQELADKLMGQYHEVYKNTGANKSEANVYADQADNLMDVSDRRTGLLGLLQQEAIKRDLQKQARFEAIKLNPIDEALQKVSSDIRQGSEDSIRDAAYNAPADSPIHPLAMSFVPQKGTVGRLIEGRDAAERGAASALGGQKIGLKDMILGSAAGDPVSAALMAFASAGVRTRAPSLMARESYALSKSLGGTGGARAIGQAGDWAAQQGTESARDWADETFDDPNAPGFKRLLAALMRR